MSMKFYFKLLFAIILSFVSVGAMFRAANSALAADCTFKTSVSVTPRTIKAGDKTPVVLGARIDTDRGTTPCDKPFQVFIEIIGPNGDLGESVEHAGNLIRSGNIGPFEQPVSWTETLTESIDFVAIVYDQNLKRLATGPRTTLTITNGGSSSGCEAYLFFKNDKNPNGFIDARAITPADGAKTSVVAEIKKCPGRARVTKIKDGQPAKIVKETFILNSGQVYSMPFPNELKEEGKYDFYLDYSPNTSGTLTTYKHIQINISSTAGSGDADGGGAKPVVTRNPFEVSKVDYDKTYDELDSLIHAESVPDWFAAVLKIFFLGIAGWSVVFMLVGAYKLILSRGNTESIANGKKTLTWAIMGFVIALLSYSIVAIFQTALGIQ